MSDGDGVVAFVLSSRDMSDIRMDGLSLVGAAWMGDASNARIWC